MMQMRKKLSARNAVREHASPKISRQQKKVPEVTEKKATELITSARKQRFVQVTTRETRSGKNSNANHVPAQDETQVVFYDDAISGASLDYKQCGDINAQCVSTTIFSPPFHISREVNESIPDKVKFTEVFMTEVQTNQVENLDRNKQLSCPCDSNLDSQTAPSMELDRRKGSAHAPPTELNSSVSHCDENKSVGNLSSEVSAIYLAMQHSKLECIDEPSHDPMSVEYCSEADEEDDYDDFDPYLFIRNLPNLSSVVPTHRPMLLPKQTRSCPPTTLVLDLDETLVHSTLEPCQDADFTFPVNYNMKAHTVYVRCRPHLKDFMERVSSLFEIIIFTASQSIYAEHLLNVLDPKRRFIRHRVYRESCVFVDGNYLKDLSVLGRDLARVIIIDNSPQAFGFQVDNGIPIESWFEDRSDQELLSLLPFLETLARVEDVRPLIAKQFNLREKIATAVCHYLNHH
ncbi:hypothetical protein QJS10_CPB22g00641 [Acorus calamus]|uniref:FCP1 homology domain-containing protein n=1 Tax=Acorus calamus TaxID=4465 RepID=A0AAV9C039_ACOCL|nr:hypothetical protein QJS10_CPB22g00641 [Acorus calamus]